jgi:hypothetical protein
LKEQEPLFRKYVDLLVQNPGEIATPTPAEPVDMVDMLNITTFDVMSNLTFSEPLHLDNSSHIP